MSSSSESTFFVEYNQVIDLISFLPTTTFTTTQTKTLTAVSACDDDQEIHSVQNGNQALVKLKRIFDKYLECPTLLDSKLESILTLLSSESIKIIHEYYAFLLTPSYEKENDKGEGLEEEKEINNEIEEERKTFNHELKSIILKRYLSIIYTMSKVRGYKHVSKYLSHQTKDVEPVLCLLRHMKEKKSQNDNNSYNDYINRGEVEVAENWEGVYVLLLWLGMLSLVPFDLNTIDSSINTANATPAINTEGTDNSKPGETTLITSMITTIQQHLSDAGPTRIIASSSLAKLFSRPDLEERELQSFVIFSNSLLQSYLSSSKSTNYDTTTIFLVMGIIQTLANIFKTGHRSTLMQRHLSLIGILWENAILLSEQCSSSCVSGSGHSSTSLVLRKFLVKLFARVGCSYLPPRIAKWRYQRGKRSLLENLSSTTELASLSTDASTKKSHNSCFSGNNESIEHDHGNAGNRDKKDDDDDLFEVPDQVEDSMAQLIQSLTDSATTVRWSAAKGIGRLTERLPVLCANDVLDAILELCNNEQNFENDNIWHGSCLTLAELARRGLLLPDRLNEVIPIVIRAIQYDVPRGSHSVGSNVRDAACYVCWAFARAYAPSILQPHVQGLSKSIVIASLFDREINCRRAASAAFQECVGRQGADNFKHGIAIMTSADYFTLGNRVDSFTNVAKKIALFEEYRHPLIDHLCEEKLFHWDSDIRKLSSLSLQMLTPLEPEYFAQVILPDLLSLCTHETLFVRHGAVLGVAEVILALGGSLDKDFGSTYQSSTLDIDQLTDEVKSTLSDIVFQIEKARLYRGRGGEIMRAAVSRYIECLSIAKIPLTVKKQVGLLDSLDVNLKHPNEDIQQAATAALSALMISYFPVGANGPSERLQDRVVNNYIKLIREEENPAATRGYSLALGRLPMKLIAHNTQTLDAVIDCLSYASNRQTKIGQQGDAETRRNAIESLVRVCETVGVGTSKQKDETSNYSTVSMNEKQIQKVFESLFSSMEDYNTDRRGDVGSWCRIAAMKGLVTLTLITVKASNIPQIFNTSLDNDNLNECDKHFPMIPSFQARIDVSFEDDVDNEVGKCLTTNQPYRKYQQMNMSSRVYFDDQLCSKVLGSILKQLSEKLDAVRYQAGVCLESLLLGPCGIPFIPQKEMFLEGLDFENKCSSHDNKLKLNWANPELTFPILMRIVNINAFFQPIISGIVISVGGLTESVTKHSTKSFLDYLRALQKAKMIGRISKIGRALIGLFDEHTRDNRVILPLLVTVDKLLSHGCLDCLLEDQRSDFPQQLVTRIRRESSKCTDIKRLMAIIPVSLGLLHSNDLNLVHKTILPFVMRLLAHRYPRIRRCTAEQLYLKLIEDDLTLPKSDQIETATNLLSEVLWDRELAPPENVRGSRNQVADLLGIHLSEKDRVGPIKKATKKSIVDEFASYQSLVETAGR